MADESRRLVSGVAGPSILLQINPGRWHLTHSVLHLSTELPASVLRGYIGGGVYEFFRNRDVACNGINFLLYFVHLLFGREINAAAPLAFGLPSQRVQVRRCPLFAKLFAADSEDGNSNSDNMLRH